MIVNTVRDSHLFRSRRRHAEATQSGWQGVQIQQLSHVSKHGA